MKKYSKKWMQTFIQDKLPADDVIVEEISKKAFEVESYEQIKDEKGNIVDTLFEIKVLPNRIADAFCLLGMAREFSAVFNLKLNDLFKTSMLNAISKYQRKDDFVKIEDKSSTKCYFGVEVEIEKQKESSAWIKEIIEKSGGRSINSLVDITNLMLYSFGQPTHVFDAEKLNGKIITRYAKKGESITLLDGKILELTENDNLICDEKNILALAGIKGGNISEVDQNTKKAFFEIANFDKEQVRKSSMYHNLRTDASKIYENGLSMGVTEDILIIIINTILTEYPDAKINFVTKSETRLKDLNKDEQDFYGINNNLTIKFTSEDLNSMAGLEISENKIIEILKRLRFEVIKKDDNGISNFLVKAPKERLDINIKEDVLEEILRIYGFDNISSIPLKIENNAFTHDKRFLLINFIQNFLIEKGYTEIFNYTFVEKGDIKVILPLGEDKAFLRTNLLDEAKKSFEKNYNYLPLIEKNEIKFFEIGSVFTNEKEEKRCVICLEDNKKKSQNLKILEDLIQKLEESLKVKINIISKNEKPSLIEFSIDEIVKQNPKIEFVKFDKNLKDIKYRKISIYPFISRDVACFTPTTLIPSFSNGEGVEQNHFGFDFDLLKKEVEKLNLQNVEKIYKFDEWTKQVEIEENNQKKIINKTSIAFRIIFQSHDRTLTAEEVEVEMQKLYNYLQDNAYIIR